MNNETNLGANQRTITLEAALDWRAVASVADGAPLRLSTAAEARIAAARRLVERIVEGGIRAYGVNTGVGALCDVIVAPEQQSQLSRNLLMSHATGVGETLPPGETRAILAAAINNFAHGYSGVRPEVVRRLVAFLNEDCLPEIPAGGSVGYLTHMAHAALVVIGAGTAKVRGTPMTGSAALEAIGAEPMTLQAKEGLSLVNGTPCATGLGAVALGRAERLLAWADVAGAMSFETLRGQMSAFAAESIALRSSEAMNVVADRLRGLLADSAILAASLGDRTQDPLSLRAIPHVHGAAFDVFRTTEDVINRELRAVTDNPVVTGSVDAPIVYSEAHAVPAALALALDSLAIAVASVAAMSERRIDRLVNPLVSRLPAFLSDVAGVGSGFMIAQYTAVSLVAENRRLAAPASLDGGITSGLQEDHLCHSTPAALKLLEILDNFECILAIELLAAAQGFELLGGDLARAPATARIQRAIRDAVPAYRDDRPLADDFATIRQLVLARHPEVVGKAI